MRPSVPTLPVAPELTVMLLRMREEEMENTGEPVSSEYVRMASDDRANDFIPDIFPSKIWVFFWG